MRYIIYGAGAVGSSLGGYLARIGSEAVLVGRPQHVARVRADGLSIKDGEGIHNIQVKAVDSLEAIPEGQEDVIFLCVKSQDTEGAMTELRKWAPSELPVFCFQNGVRNEEMAAEFFENIYGVLVSVGVRYVGPGQIVHYAPKSLTLGRYPNGLDDLAESVGDVLNAAGYKITLSSDVIAVKWSKLIMNLSNAFYAITGLSILEGRNIFEGPAFLADLFEEGILVLESARIKYEPIPDRPSPRETVDRLRQSTEPRPLPENPDFNYYPSTWQDLQLRRGTTEVASFNGEIVALGKQVGVPTPLNELLQRSVEDMAANNESPGKYSVAQLRAMLS
jgi:2-dehydropantoate 2-reductase